MPIVGTTPEAIHLAEERGAFGRVLARPGLPPQARHRHVLSRGRRIAEEIGYPVLVRPSYVLGGRGMEIVYDDARARALPRVRGQPRSTEHPVLVDRFLDDAVEIDVDALYDGEELFLGGVMEHIEEAGIHSGDSAARCRRSPSGRETTRARSRARPRRSPRASGSRPAQRAVRDGLRRALRPRGEPARLAPCPFVSKATGVPLAKAAAR